MATAIFPSGLLHPVRTLRSRYATRSWAQSDERSGGLRAPDERAQSAERIAAYARSGYFHMEYTPGMFVVHDLPPD
ncbi:hypothetical protein HDG40_002029 [Paraburkholderia sp. JPY158]|uniref:Uncharacterized protein n=1 Tax=Paraburkholderia atlantica TaxID=2654982 RepID=A0A7W8Q5V3_PARAM|nr:hypothetical protein [Paraburkholderia atlantica]MBB5423885.1 hypothetical protein [Paraburkholderia atlantica]